MRPTDHPFQPAGTWAAALLALLLAAPAGPAQAPPPPVDLLPPRPVPEAVPGVICPTPAGATERPPSKVGSIFIIGNEVTRQDVILRQLPEGLAPGQVLQYPDLRVAERNLARLGIFVTDGQTGVGPSVEVINRQGDEEYKDLLVRVQEARTTSLLFGASVNSDTELSGTVLFNERNFDITRLPTSFNDLLSGHAFRGGGQELRLEATPGNKVQRYVASWREPFLFDSPFGLTVSTYYWDQVYDEYTESRLGGRLMLDRQLPEHWHFNSTVRIEDVGVHDVVPWDPPDYLNVAGDHFLFGASATFTRDTRDTRLLATAGSVLALSFEEVTGQFTFPRVNVDYTKYCTVHQRPNGSGRQVLTYHGQMEWEGSQAPVYERFFAGGFRSMRGFEFRGISPLYNGPLNQNGLDANGVPIGGDFLLLNSLEYRFPVLANDQLYLVAFMDSGTVESRLEIKDYRVSAGFGVRLLLPFLSPEPFALDFGFPIVKGPGDKEQVFSFWVGAFR